MHALTLSLLAVPALSAVLPRATQEWSIPTMDVHLMGRDTGLPGNTWPESSKFNTTLDFTLTLPDTSVKCSANWKYQQVSTEEWQCAGDAGVSFHLGPASDGKISDASWTLSVSRKVGYETYVASQSIENNTPGAPNSYLSCIGGAPLSGVRCKLNSWAGKPGPIVLSASSQ